MLDLRRRQFITLLGGGQQASRTVPIVFVNVTYPIGRGYIAIWRTRK